MALGRGRGLLPDTAILTLTNIPVEPIVLLAASRSPTSPWGSSGAATRGGTWSVFAAAVGWFAVLYPNIGALPLPAAVVDAYQGIMPTYLYAFQFPVSEMTATPRCRSSRRCSRACCSPSIVACLVVAYSAWVWRLSLVEAAGGRRRVDDAEGLARTAAAPEGPATGSPPGALPPAARRRMTKP